MWQFRDPAMFTDALTAELRESARYPLGYEALFRLATQVVNPIVFGEWLGMALMAVSAWLIFLIVREHTDWRPAGWIAAALFLALIDIHRFYGGFPRAFVHPVVLLTVLLALRNHQLAAALVAAAGALFYPPAALLAVGVLLVCSVRWRDRRLDRRRAAFAGLALALSALFVLGPQLVTGAPPRVMSAAEARGFPEFGEHGPLHFFVPSVVDYLRQNRSGFDLRAAGSILLLAALALLLVRRENLRLLRAEVLAMPVVALGAFAVSQAVLFRLYLPHRYTYPLLAFFAIVVGVTLRPTWTALAARGRLLPAFALLCAPVLIYALAVYAFPLGPMQPLESVGWGVAAVALAAVAAVWLRRAPAAGALATAAGLVVALLFVPGHWARGSVCVDRPVTGYLASLPKDAVIAGDPNDLKCLPATAKRPVVISTQLSPSYEADYFRRGRRRMFDTLRAYYGPSTDAIVDLKTRYGADYLWVRRDAIEKEMAPGGYRWQRRQQPYGQFVRDLLSAGEPASLSLPEECRRWRLGPAEVYDISCIAAK